jgi:uncharacterized tellurite resistance protein B-like protein
VISGIRRFFEENLKPVADDPSDRNLCRVQLATAALMFELLKVDSHIDDRETAAVREALSRAFPLDGDQLDEIIALADEESQQATSLYEFTSLINAEFEPDRKVALIANLWRVAFADHVLDKYEENLIRRTADLIYVSHSDFIRTKLQVREEIAAQKSSSQ